MRKLLITGSGSYIGTNVENWLNNSADDFRIDTLDMENDDWDSKDFSKYDVVFHVAGIAHVSKDPDLKDLYYKVNRDLTIQTAKKAKNEGVEQFIFMSSIIIYGDSGKIGERKVINKETEPAPDDFYGDSKLQAERGINELNDNDFKVVILRPPMIYGKNSKGNYKKLSKAAKVLPIFPYVNNQRSMLYINNLAELIRLIIKNEEKGIFYPQNYNYVNTSEMAKIISNVNNKSLYLTKIFNPFLRLANKKIDIIDKAFGNLVYDKSISEYKDDYRVRSFKESIIETEEG